MIFAKIQQVIKGDNNVNKRTVGVANSSGGLTSFL